VIKLVLPDSSEYKGMEAVRGRPNESGIAIEAVLHSNRTHLLRIDDNPSIRPLFVEEVEEYLGHIAVVIPPERL
jgi:hypothetical protein